MRSFSYLAGPFFMAAVLLSSGASAETGGPDRGGYEWADSQETAVSYEWIDISTVGTRVEVGDDEESDLAPIGFDFGFYGDVYDQFRMGSNGYITFQENDIRHFEGQHGLPDEWVPNLVIYGFYQDLNPTAETSHEIYFATMGAESDRQLVVTWDCIDLFRGAEEPFEVPSDPVTFQIVLYEGTNAIQVNVQDSSSGITGNLWSLNTLIGVENENGTVGIGLWPDVIPDEYAVRFELSTGQALLPAEQVVTGSFGEPTVLDFELANFADWEIAATIETESASGWTADPSSDNLTVAAGSAEAFSVSVEDPSVGDPSGVSNAYVDDVSVTATIDGDELTADAQVRLALPSDEWEYIADLPEAVGGVRLVSDGAYLYAMGGFSVTFPNTNPTFFDKTWRWNPLTDSWDDEAMADLPIPVAVGGACHLDGRIFYMGGNTEGRGYNPDILIYDIQSDSWSTGSRPPHAMSQFLFACSEGNVYVIGGLTDFDDDLLFPGQDCPPPSSPDDTCSPPECCWDANEAALRIYDVENDSWSLGADPDHAYIGSVAGVIDGRIVLLGEYADPENPTYHHTETAIYDIGRDTWSVGPLPNFNRADPCGAVFNDLLCLTGGVFPEWGRTWECYADGVWILQVDELQKLRYSSGAAALNGQLYVVGGLADMGPVRQAERWPASGPLEPPVEPEAEEIPDVAPDAGEADLEPEPEAVPDTGTSGEPDEGCSCTSALGHSRHTAILLLGVLLGLFLARRRNRRSPG